MLPEPAAVALDEFLDRHDLDVDSVGDLAVLCRDRLAADVAEIAELRSAGHHPVPEVSFDDFCDDPDGAHRELIRRRGCVIVRGTFELGEALDWDIQLAGYLERNGFDDHAAGSGIRGIYWSKPQIAARQHPRMVVLRRRLNSIWNHPGDDRWFDPDHDIGYADRIRRRPPGATAPGLPPHCDSPAGAGWRADENHLVFRHVLAGHPERHDPWDASHRTGPVGVTAGPAGAFRTFQGWTALSEAHPEDGGLVVAPTLRALEHLLVTGLAREAGVWGEPEPAPRRARVDDVIAPAVTPIPPVHPGDTVWWHGDLIHGVDDAANDSRWSNVMYVPVSPRCPRNDAYQPTMLDRFDAGRSPIDFPAEHLETTFAGRATRDDLNDVGRQQFGIDAVADGPVAGAGPIGSAATPI